MPEESPRLSIADYALRQARLAAEARSVDSNRPEPPPNPWPLVPIAELPEPTPTPWVWPGYLARHAATLLVGSPKAGKTTLIAALLRDLQIGSGLVTTSIGAPIICVSEEGAGVWSVRRDKFEIGPGVNMILRPFKVRSDIRGWLQFVNRVADHTRTIGAGLVILDTLASLWPVESENDAAEVQAALMPLTEIAESGASLLIVHHPTKAAVESGFNARGSGALTGWADLIVRLCRYDDTNPTDTRRKLEAIGRFDDIPPELVIDFAGSGYSFVGEPWKVERLDRHKTVADIVAGSDAPLSAKAVRERWPEDRKPSEKDISAMLNEGSNVGKWSRRGIGTAKDPFEFFPTRLVGTYGQLPTF